MTDPIFGRKKRKITYAASSQGVQKAEKALKRLGFESKINFAKSNLLSRSTVTKFFQCQPIQFDSLKRICEALILDWQEIVSKSEEQQSKRLEINEPNNSDTNEGMEQVRTLSRKVTVLDKQSQVIKVVIILEGDFNSINNNLSVTLQTILREFSGDTIKITDIEEGSIRLIIEGSPEDIEQLLSRFKSGELTEVSGFPVEDVQILSESSDEDESNELNDKWRLVQEIVSQRVYTRNLSGADLSDADLSDADLSGINLSGTDLSGTGLSGAILILANLRGADLSGADLRSADLKGANLNGANLNGANLNGADLFDANLSGADLGRTDLSGAILSDAILSGAILILANLSGTDLSGADLRGAYLNGARIDTLTKIDSKWHLAWEIVNQGARERDLMGIDLRGANLSGADLSGADLSGADLSGADLSGADLSGADLSGADLSGADLSSADLRGANLYRAVVEKAQFGANLGLTEEMKLDLKRRGAIFEDSPGDRSGVLSRR